MNMKECLLKCKDFIVSIRNARHPEVVEQDASELKNYEVLSPDCPHDGLRNLLRHYRSRLWAQDLRQCPQEILRQQYEIYLEWKSFAEMSMGKDAECSFYEWLLRKADSAFIFKPGALVQYDGQYAIVDQIGYPYPTDVWRIGDGDGQLHMVSVLRPAHYVMIKFSDNKTLAVEVSDVKLKPAGIPMEVLSLVRDGIKEDSAREETPNA